MSKYIIETTADVTNPEPDRRSRDWTKLPTIPKGTRFVVEMLNADGFSTIQRSGGSYGWTATHTDLGKLIQANSKDVAPASVSELAKVHGCNYGADEILRALIKLGRVKPEDFTAVAEAINADENF